MATEEPQVSLEEIALRAMHGEQPVTPEIAVPADGTCVLPGGLVYDPLAPDRVLYQAEVRELTGADEEALAKARSAGGHKFLSALLSRGVVEVGGEPVSPTLLKRLLVGDRDFLFLEIRRATYGPDLPGLVVQCPHCSEMLDVNLSLDDIPVRRLESSEDRTFEVPLRKGGHALVRLPVGSDQDEALSNPNMSASEMNSVLLSRAVLSLTNAAGAETGVASNIDLVRNLGIADRSSILSEIATRQPGPQYDEVKITHEECGGEIPLPIGPGDLFQGM